MTMVGVDRARAARIGLVLLATLALVAVVVSIAITRPVMAAHDVLGPAVAPTTISPDSPGIYLFQGQNPECPAGTTELKFEGEGGVSGDHTDSVTIDGTEVTVSLTADGNEITTFTVTNGLAAHVFVKATEDTNAYNYSGQAGGGIAHDDGLVSPATDSISHVAFCLIAAPAPPPPVTGDLVINKTDGTNALPGVVFTLSGGGLSTPLTDTTDAAGNANFDDLAPGTYTLTETTPAGYQPKGPWAVTVSDTGVVTIAGLTATNGSFTIVNSVIPPPPPAPVTGDLVLNKTSGGSALAGVTFTLTGGSLAAPLVDVTDAAGQASFDDLEPGTYTLTETTPAGFDPKGPWTVTVSAEGVVTVSGLTAGTDGSFTIVNTRSGTLGGTPTPAPTPAPVRQGTLSSVPNTATESGATAVPVLASGLGALLLIVAGIGYSVNRRRAG